MATIAMTVDTFAEHIKNDGLVFIDFWASWCPPCRAFAPIFDAAAEKHPDATWAKVDTQAEQELAGALEIRSIPTLMVFREGVLLYAEPGMLSAAALDEIANTARALDMDQIRRKLTSHVDAFGAPPSSMPHLLRAQMRSCTKMTAR